MSCCRTCTCARMRWCVSPSSSSRLASIAAPAALSLTSRALRGFEVPYLAQGCEQGHRRFTLTPSASLRVPCASRNRGDATGRISQRALNAPLKNSLLRLSAFRGPTLDFCDARRQRGAGPALPTALRPPWWCATSRGLPASRDATRRSPVSGVRRGVRMNGTSRAD